MPFDPIGDHDTRGYLRNFAGEKDPARIKRIEHHAFAANVLTALTALHRLLAGHFRPGMMPLSQTVERLTSNPGLTTTKPLPNSGPGF